MLNQEQLAELEKTNPDLAKIITASFTEMQEKIKTSDGKVTELSAEVAAHKAAKAKADQEAADAAFKKAHPDVPFELIPAGLDEAGKKAWVSKFEEVLKSKATPAGDPQNPWERAGDINPSLDPAAAAKLAEQNKKREELVRSGDAHGVASMIFSKFFKRPAPAGSPS